MEVKNKKTGVIKSVKNEMEMSMYISTGEWTLVKETKIEPKKEDEEVKPTFSKKGFNSKKND